MKGNTILMCKIQSNHIQILYSLSFVHAQLDVKYRIPYIQIDANYYEIFIKILTNNRYEIWFELEMIPRSLASNGIPFKKTKNTPKKLPVAKKISRVISHKRLWKQMFTLICLENNYNELFEIGGKRYCIFS